MPHRTTPTPRAVAITLLAGCALFNTLGTRLAAQTVAPASQPQPARPLAATSPASAASAGQGAPPLDLPAAQASGAAAAAPDPNVPRLSIDALVQTVLANNPGVIAAQRSRDAAAANVIGARALPNPSLTYSRGNQRAVSPSSTAGYTQTIGVSQLIENPALRRARLGAASADERASGQQVSLTRNELVAQVLLGAYEYLLRQEEAVAAGEALALLQQVNSRVRARVGSGEAPRYELIKADAEVVTAASQRQTSLLLAEQSAIALNRLAAGALPARWTLDANLQGDQSVRDFEQIRRMAAERNPELRVLQAEFDKAEAQIDGARAERWPGVTLNYSRGRDPDVQQNTVGISVQVPLFDQRNGPIAAASANLERARTRLEGRRAELDQQVLYAWRALEAARLRVQALSEAAVRDAESALRVADAAYRFGERGILDVLDAQRVLRSVRADLLVARYQVQSAQIELDLLSGRWVDTPASGATPSIR